MMKTMLINFALCGALLSGCVESRSDKHAEKPFELEELDACLAIVVDMSGSFAESWDDKAYSLFLNLSDRFFTEGAGLESRVVICQLSGGGDVVLFEGTPDELRNRFQSPEELNLFLQENSDPQGSQVYRSTAETLDYVSHLPGVTERTRLLTVVLSDLRDSESNIDQRNQAGRDMIASLTRYREKGGGLALYFVEQEEVTLWRKILDKAGFDGGHYVIENSVVANPQLPSFD